MIDIIKKLIKPKKKLLLLLRNYGRKYSKSSIFLFLIYFFNDNVRILWELFSRATLIIFMTYLFAKFSIYSKNRSIFKWIWLEIKYNQLKPYMVYFISIGVNY